MISSTTDDLTTQRTGGIAVSEQTNDNNGQKFDLVPIPGTNGYQQTVKIDPNQPLILSVTNASGDVQITGSDQPDVQIVARKHNGDVNDTTDPGLALTVDGNQISLRPTWQSMSGFGDAARALKEQIQEGLSKGKWNFSGVPKLGMNEEYDFRIQVPRALAAHSRLSIKTASGEAEIENVTADVTVGTASGDIDAKAISGQVAIHTASGDVAAHDITGSLEINSASGDILVKGGDAWTAVRTMSGDLALTDTTLRNARITTVSGDLVGVVTLDNKADYTFETVSGDLSLTCRLPHDATSRLTFRSISGEAAVNDGWTATGKKEWKTGDGPDGPSIRTRSVSGNLRVAGSRDGDVHLRAETPQTPRPSDTAQPQSGMDEIKSYAAQAREMADEMKRMFTSPTPPTPPTPPTAPSAPTAPTAPMSQADFDAAQAQHDAEQAHRDAEQAQRDAEQAQRDREQAQRDHEQALRDEAPAQPQNAAGQSGDWWAERAEIETQNTAPITSPAAGPSTSQPPATPTAQPTEPIRSGAAAEEDPARRKVLEQVERGEIDIEEALNRLEQSDGETA